MKDKDNMPLIIMAIFFIGFIIMVFLTIKN